MQRSRLNISWHNSMLDLRLIHRVAIAFICAACVGAMLLPSGSARLMIFAPLLIAAISAAAAGLDFGRTVPNAVILAVAIIVAPAFFRVVPQVRTGNSYAKAITSVSTDARVTPAAAHTPGAEQSPSNAMRSEVHHGGAVAQTTPPAGKQAPAETADAQAGAAVQHDAEKLDAARQTTLPIASTPQPPNNKVFPSSVRVRLLECAFPNCEARQLHGNVVVSFSDGHEEEVTTGGDCTGARFATSDRLTIGWTAGTHYDNGYDVKFHNKTLMLYRAGAIFAHFETERPKIEEWEVRPNGNDVVIQSRASHGPSCVQLFDIPSGALRQQLWGYEITSTSPDWARRFAEASLRQPSPRSGRTDLTPTRYAAYTPPPGSQEREAILDAVRCDFYLGDAAAAHRNPRKILFNVHFLRSNGDWALTRVTAVDGAGKRTHEDFRWALLRKKTGRWVDVNYFDSLRPFASEIEAQDALNMPGSTIKDLWRVFPEAPKDIFPGPSERGRGSKGD